MKRALFAVPIVLLIISFSLAQEKPPDWAQRDFNSPADKVFAAALKSIQEQKHEVKKTDEAAHKVEFRVGVTAWSWGYNMVLTVTPIDDSHSRVLTAVAKKGGDVLSWGSGKKEVKKIYEGMDSALANRPNPYSKTKP